MAPISWQGLLFVGEPALRSRYLIQTLRDCFNRPRHLLPFGVVTAVEQRLTFVALAQMKPSVESKARVVLSQKARVTAGADRNRKRWNA
jgi:hypothetical protein